MSGTNDFDAVVMLPLPDGMTRMEDGHAYQLYSLHPRLGWLGPWKSYATESGCLQAMREHFMVKYPHYEKWAVIDRTCNHRSIYEAEKGEK